MYTTIFNSPSLPHYFMPCVKFLICLFLHSSVPIFLAKFAFQRNFLAAVLPLLAFLCCPACRYETRTPYFKFAWTGLLGDISLTPQHMTGVEEGGARDLSQVPLNGQHRHAGAVQQARCTGSEKCEEGQLSGFLWIFHEENLI